MNSIKTQSVHDVSRGMKPLTYEKYLVLLLSAVTTYDAANGLTKNCSKRSIQTHEFEVETDDSYVD